MQFFVISKKHLRLLKNSLFFCVVFTSTSLSFHNSERCNWLLREGMLVLQEGPEMGEFKNVHQSPKKRFHRLT